MVFPLSPPTVSFCFFLICLIWIDFWNMFSGSFLLCFLFRQREVPRGDYVRYREKPGFVVTKAYRRYYRCSPLAFVSGETKRLGGNVCGRVLLCVRPLPRRLNWGKVETAKNPSAKRETVPARPLFRYWPSLRLCSRYRRIKSLMAVCCRVDTARTSLFF